ncbi:Calcium/calmodulin-dependent/calcium-dependent protein kinase [Purpureocillium lavendulum]|uniref:Calcium/calmodulin-dependent/calcium-dependent protein kinase n=1 Tax=Purpureocillium lavendulum TaxID=1247861 RepID=A0AB34FW42_9HYPO|nr:Calcium/calmodulin-dependent/calcium-dependent protein kinase [Purpureocillium lavendulum]
MSRRSRRGVTGGGGGNNHDVAGLAPEGSLPVDGSWRMVEGEHDSFDTTILPSSLPADDDDDILMPLSSGQPSSGFPSQLSTGAIGGGGGGSQSQDSIRDFAKHQDDEQVILREPFRPSMVVSRRASAQGGSSSSAAAAAYRTPEPQFRMPTVDVISTGGGSSGNNSVRTVRRYGWAAADAAADDYDDDEDGGGGGGSLRRRGVKASSLGSPSKNRTRRRRRDSFDTPAGDKGGAARRTGSGSRAQGPLEGIKRHLLAALPSTIYRLLVWAGEVVLIAMNYAKYPLGALLAVYLVFGGLIVAQNMATRSLSAAVSPLCRVPGVSLLGLPFCPPSSSSSSLFPSLFPNGTARPQGQGQGQGQQRNVEFDDLMGVQSKFEHVLEKSADGVSLPFEMKRSEAAVRDLRSLVRHSDIQARNELVLEFDGYIDTARRAAADLQKFNTHVGSAVDAVISINRWTSRYIDSLSPAALDGSPSVLAEWTAWLFYPFQPAVDDGQPFSERAITDKYIEHTALVSDRIAALILEAQAILRLLTKAEDHLSLIYDITSRTSSTIASRRDAILWNVWTLVGANSKRLHNLAQQLALLRQVDAQRSSAVEQVSALILELEGIQAGLGDLRDRVAEPELAAVAGTDGAGAPRIPLSVHIETIDRGVERLQGARARLRVAEDERVRDAMARGGIKKEEERLIDARGR